MCVKEIGLYVQFVITILDAIVKHNQGHLNDHLMNMRFFTLTTNKMFIYMSSNFFEESC